jgi:hypothetical protein
LAKISDVVAQQQRKRKRKGVQKTLEARRMKNHAKNTRKSEAEAIS